MTSLNLKSRKLRQPLDLISLCLLALLLLLASCRALPEGPAAPGQEPTWPYSYRVVNTFPHDPGAFTEGLVFDGGLLYESTGLKEHSSLREVDLSTGEVRRRYDLPGDLFGEGLTLYGDKLIQLTWKSHLAFAYRQEDFELLRTFAYPFDGWGITSDGRRLIASDGTATLHFLDPDTLAPAGSLEVRDGNGLVSRLNELEFVKGEIYANIWQTDDIVRISPQTGRVTGRINLQGLLAREDLKQPVDVLNGIAYDAVGDRLFVTGKLWPTLFEIELTEAR